jgi:hypothetical protein
VEFFFVMNNTGTEPRRPWCECTEMADNPASHRIAYAPDLVLCSGEWGGHQPKGVHLKKKVIAIPGIQVPDCGYAGDLGEARQIAERSFSPGIEGGFRGIVKNVIPRDLPQTGVNGIR